MTAAALLLLVPLTAATTNVKTNADPACPCTDVRAVFHGDKLTATGAMAELLRSEGSPCNDTDVLDYQGARTSGSSVTAFCYPADYGSFQCSAWDAGPRSKAHPCSASSPPAYCSQRWCYVDPQNCRLSEHDIQGTTLFEWSSDYETPLYFSYGTCGEALGYEFSEALHARAGQGEVILVGIPTMDYPMHFKRAADGSALTGIGPEYFDEGVPWEGSMISYMDAIVEESIFKAFNYTYTSNGARVAKPSSEYTATVHDVSNRVLNMGGSDFWMTPERAGMAAFSAPFHIDIHWLWVARSVEDHSLWTKAFRVFEPFKISTWSTLFGLVVFMSLVELWIFRDQWRHSEAWLDAKTRKAKASVAVSLWGGYVARSCMHLSAGFPDEGKSTAETIAWVGWAFLILIVVAAYTANLAAFLLRGPTSYYIKSMDQAVAEKKIVCVALQVKPELEIRYPGARLRGLSFSGEFADDYKENSCDAVVWSMPVVQRLPSTARFICDMNLVAVDKVLEKTWAFPASPQLAPSLTYWMQQVQKKTGGKYADTFEQKYYADACTDVDLLEEKMLGTAIGRRLRGGGKGGKGGAAGGAAGLAGQGGASGGLGFTDVGTSSSDGMSRLGPDAFAGVIIVWFVFVVVAMVRSTYDYHLTDGLAFTEKQQKEKERRRKASNLQVELKNVRKKAGGTSEIMMKLDNLGRDMDARLTALERSKSAGEISGRSPPSSPSFSREEAAEHKL